MNTHTAWNDPLRAAENLIRESLTSTKELALDESVRHATNDALALGVDHAVSIACPASVVRGETRRRQTLLRAPTVCAVLEPGTASKDGMAGCDRDGRQLS
jgi:hypothetical protein